MPIKEIRHYFSGSSNKTNEIIYDGKCENVK